MSNFNEGGIDRHTEARTIRGAKLADVEQLRSTVIRELQANNRLRPYFKFGDLPISFVEGQSAHVLCIGDSGAAKTTTLRTLMSYVMPLSLSRVQNILERSQRGPSSPQEFARSKTFQAVVYNAKVENVPFLAALGFDTSIDLIILDPADERGFAWDLAKDYASREDLDHLLNLLIPTRGESRGDNSTTEFFESTARQLIQDIMISLRNAALAQGLQPAWTLRDIMNAIGRRVYLRQLFQWHDIPEEAIDRLDLYPATLDGVFATARALINPFRQAAERWDEAARLGRKISFKDWALRGSNTVLVLPNTESNVLVNGPLNRLMLRALTEVVLTHEHSIVHDESGCKHARRRYFFFDELGNAGKLSSLPRLLSEGREFGVNAVLGLHAISQLERTYGKEEANNILANCPYNALLRAGDTATAEWMSKFCGDCEREHKKITVTSGSTSTTTWGTQESNTVGVSKGQTITEGENTSTSTNEGEAETKGYQGNSRSSSNQKSRGSSDTNGRSTSIAKSHQDNESQTTGNTRGGSSGTSSSRSETVELRHENVLLYSEFRNFPDPAKTRRVGMVAHVPSLGTWQVEMSLDEMLKQLEKPLATVAPFQKWKDDDRVSRAKAWTTEDFRRLGIAPIVSRKALATTKAATRNPLALPDHETFDDECTLPPPTFDFDIRPRSDLQYECRPNR